MHLSSLNFLDWKKHVPCCLCGESRAIQHSVCQQCWDSLPWQKQHIRRHDIECFVSCHYDFPINRIIHQFKQQGKFEFIELLTACYLEKPKPRVQAIVPMPIATEKLIQRGFHPSYLLAKALSQHWQIPIWQPVSRHDGHAQRGLSRADRLSNLLDQFYLNTKHCRYKHVLMLDDVITTGASLAALQQQLEQLGCSQIQSLCICDAAH